MPFEPSDDVAYIKGSNPNQCPIIGPRQTWRSAERDLVLWGLSSTMASSKLAFHVISRAFDRRTEFKGFAIELVQEDATRLAQDDGLDYLIARFNQRYRTQDNDAKLFRLQRFENLTRRSGESFESFRNRWSAMLEEVKADGLADQYREHLYRVPGQKGVWSSTAPAARRFIMAAKLSNEQLAMVRNQVDWSSETANLHQVLEVVGTLFFSNLASDDKVTGERNYLANDDFQSHHSETEEVFVNDNDDVESIVSETSDSNVLWSDETNCFMLYEGDDAYAVEWNDSLDDFVWLTGNWTGLQTNQCRICKKFGHWGNECARNPKNKGKSNFKFGKGFSKGGSRKGKGKGKGRKGGGKGGRHRNASRIPSRYRDDRLNQQAKYRRTSNQKRVYWDDTSPSPNDDDDDPSSFLNDNIYFSQVAITDSEDWSVMSDPLPMPNHQQQMAVDSDQESVVQVQNAVEPVIEPEQPEVHEQIQQHEDQVPPNQQDVQEEEEVHFADGHDAPNPTLQNPQEQPDMDNPNGNAQQAIQPSHDHAHVNMLVAMLTYFSRIAKAKIPDELRGASISMARQKLSQALSAFSDSEFLTVYQTMHPTVDTDVLAAKIMRATGMFREVEKISMRDMDRFQVHLSTICGGYCGNDEQEVEERCDQWEHTHTRLRMKLWRKLIANLIKDYRIMNGQEVDPHDSVISLDALHLPQTNLVPAKDLWLDNFKKLGTRIKFVKFKDERTSPSTSTSPPLTRHADSSTKNRFVQTAMNAPYSGICNHDSYRDHRDQLSQPQPSTMPQGDFYETHTSLARLHEPDAEFITPERPVPIREEREKDVFRGDWTPKSSLSRTDSYKLPSYPRRSRQDSDDEEPSRTRGSGADRLFGNTNIKTTGPPRFGTPSKSATFDISKYDYENRHVLSAVGRYNYQAAFPRTARIDNERQQYEPQQQRDLKITAADCPTWKQVQDRERRALDGHNAFGLGSSETPPERHNSNALGQNLRGSGTRPNHANSFTAFGQDFRDSGTGPYRRNSNDAFGQMFQDFRDPKDRRGSNDSVQVTFHVDVEPCTPIAHDIESESQCKHCEIPIATGYESCPSCLLLFAGLDRQTSTCGTDTADDNEVEENFYLFDDDFWFLSDDESENLNLFTDIQDVELAEPIFASKSNQTPSVPLVIDCGASKCMGSSDAVQALQKIVGGKFEPDSSVDFKFAGNGKEKSQGSCILNASCLGPNTQLKVHQIRSKGTPILMSVEQLRGMNAILYCSQNVMSVRTGNSRERTYLQLAQEKSGHMTLDLANPKRLTPSEIGELHRSTRSQTDSKSYCATAGSQN